MRIFPFGKTMETSPPDSLKEQKKLATIHDVNYPIIFQYVAFRIGDSAAAEQLTSQIFLLMAEEPDICKDEVDCPKKLLLSLAARAVMDYKHHGVHRERTAVSKPKILESIGALPEDHQMVLALMYGCHLPIEQVAEFLNRSVGKTRLLQAQAVMTLHRKMLPHD